MGADSAAENIPNAPEFICPKVVDFNEKRLRWASLVRVLRSTKHNSILEYYVHYLLTMLTLIFAENYSGMFYYKAQWAKK